MVKEAVRSGMSALGWQQEPDPQRGDIAIVWGMNGQNQRLLNEYSATGRKLLMVDLGYWNRRGLGDIKASSYKITINSVHPNEYIDAAYGGDDRYAKTGGPACSEWNKNGAYILVSGMGPKGCKMYSQKHGEWDRMAIEEIKRHTNMPIMYRPKPSDKMPIEMKGAVNIPTSQPIVVSLRNAHAVVTHHGNSALDGIWSGVPCFASGGVGLLFGKSDLSDIEHPLYPENRMDILHRLAWFNWSFDDIFRGKPFKHLRDKGII